jgi:hypothetical protein
MKLRCACEWGEWSRLSGDHRIWSESDPDPTSSRMRAVLLITAPVGLRVSFARLVRYFRRLPCLCVLPQTVVTVKQYRPVKWSM